MTKKKVFYSSLFFLIFFLLPILTANAEDTSSISANTIQYFSELKPPTLSIRIPQLTFSQIKDLFTQEEDGIYLHIPWVGQYLKAIYNFSLGIVSIVAVVMLILAGLQIITSGGGEKKTAAYKKITQIMIGLAIAWGSYAILYNINPELVQFKALKVKFVEREEIEVSPADEPATDGPAEASVGSANVPYYPQYEGPWAAKKPGDSVWPLSDIQKGRTDCTDIQERGCGPTSLAMVLKFYGENVTPLDTAKWGLGCKGAWQPSNTMPSFSKKWPNLKGQIFYKNNKDKIIELLKKGKPIVYNCGPCEGTNSRNALKTYRGHYIVLTGISGNIISVNDPGARKENRILSMTIDQFNNGFKVAVYVDKK